MDPFLGLVALAKVLKNHIRMKLPLEHVAREQICRVAIRLSGMAMIVAGRTGLPPSELGAINQTRDALRQAARWQHADGTDEDFNRLVATPINEAVDAIVTLGYVVLGRREVAPASPIALPTLEGQSTELLAGSPCPAQNEAILQRAPAMAAAGDLARILGYPNGGKSLGNCLGRYRNNHPDCAIAVGEIDNKKSRDPEYLYRIDDVVGVVRDWIARNSKD
jgi:hypothetical protein